MRREIPEWPVKKWSPSPLCSHLILENTVSAIILSDLKPLVDACEHRSSEFAYVVVARVVDRSKADTIERRDVTVEALAAFLPLRDAAEPVTDRQLADAALACIRVALCAALGDREKTKLKVTIWGPKGQEQLVSHRVTVVQAPAREIATVRPASHRRGAFVSSNGPTWRAMIAEAEAAGEPVGDLVRAAAQVAAKAESNGGPQLPLSRETMEVLRGSTGIGSAATTLFAAERPSTLSRYAGRFLAAARASVQHQRDVDTER